jgi:flagellar biosynthetic protein FlhB
VTRPEAKKEAKEQEGDPLLKARIRSIQRDRARKRMMSAVKKADVIITNPTHIAIALQYDRDKMVAPRLIAKGADLVAEKIKKIAAEAGIPMVENVPLARAMFKSVKIGQMIPRNLFQAVAEVLAYVYKLKNKRF